MTKLKGIVLALMLALPVTAAAQNTTKDEAAEKQRKMNLLIEQVVADIPDLKLGENRAFVFASLGNLVWKADPAAGRGLFDKAIAELMAAQALAGSAKKTMYGQNELLTGNSARPQILNIIARRDAEMALDALIRTRPSIIQDALQYQAGKSQKVSNYSSNNYLSQNELNMEQTFLRMAADQNPERAASLLRESLKKGVSGETLNLLKKLHDKEPATAATLGSEIVDKMLKSKFMTAGDQPDYGLISAATMFLTDFIRERGPNDKSFTFSASQMRSLAGQLISFQLDQGNSRGYFGGNVLQIAEKLSPASVERLRQVQRNYGGFGHDYDPEVQRVVGSNLSADQLLSEAKRFPMAQRAGIYQTAAQKYAQAGNIAAARQILEDNFSDGALENAIQSLDWQNVSNLQSAGKFAEAELIIDEMPEINRIPALINLANNALNKNEAENRSYAIGVLGKARSLIGDRPENNHEMSTLLQIAGVYARLDPNESFGLLSSLLPQINEITNAAIVFTQFQGNQSIRQGEILMSQGSTVGIYLDYSVFQKLEKVDFERTANLIAGLERIETRIKLRLQLAENGLN